MRRDIVGAWLLGEEEGEALCPFPVVSISPQPITGRRRMRVGASVLSWETMRMAALN